MADAILDVFASDAFNMTSLTIGIEHQPYQPKTIGSMGLFRTEPVNTEDFAIEEEFGTLRLLPTYARGSMPDFDVENRRRVRKFVIPHIPHNDKIMANDIQGVRAFGKAKMFQTLAAITAKKLRSMRANHEVTHEHMRLGAVKGVVYDADGTTVLFNWFNEFGITQQSYNFDFTTANQVKLTNHAIIRHIEDSLGADTYRGVRCICGQTFFDDLTTCPEVKDAYNRWQDGQQLRQANVRRPFEYAGVQYVEYRGQMGGTKFVTDTQAHFFPYGTQDLFIRGNAPADFLETANTMGRPIYVKQERMKFNKGIQFHSQSNPIFLCSRPSLLVLGIDTK